MSLIMPLFDKYIYEVVTKVINYTSTDECKRDNACVRGTRKQVSFDTNITVFHYSYKKLSIYKRLKCTLTKKTKWKNVTVN